MTGCTAMLVVPVTLSLLVSFVTAGPVVKTKYGAVEGMASNLSQNFLGIPFAAPPVGSLR